LGGRADELLGVGLLVARAAEHPDLLVRVVAQDGVAAGGLVADFDAEEARQRRGGRRLVRAGVQVVQRDGLLGLVVRELVADELQTVLGLGGLAGVLVAVVVDVPLVGVAALDRLGRRVGLGRRERD